MKKLYFIFFLVCVVSINCFASETSNNWTRIWGNVDYDYATDVIALNGRAYVVGSTYVNFSIGDVVYLICYNNNGTKQWTRTSENARASFPNIAYSGGNIYVAGYTSSKHGFDGQTNIGGTDFFLTKYNSIGTKQWTRIFGTPYNDYCKDVAAFGSSVYVVGTYDSSDNRLIKYNSSGSNLWICDCLGSSITVDSSENIYIAGSTLRSFDGQTNNGGFDLCLTKYNNSGVKQWSRIWGSSFKDVANDVTVDEVGNIYVVGYTDGSFDGQNNNGVSDLCLTSYSSNGTKHWTRIWGSSDVDYGNSVSVDNVGNIYVTGYTKWSSDWQLQDSCLIKYNSSGSNLWTKIWGSPRKDGGNGVSVDSAENIYVAGYTHGSFAGQTNCGWGDSFLTKIPAEYLAGLITVVSGAIGNGSSNTPYDLGITTQDWNDSSMLCLSINGNIASNIFITQTSGSVNFSATGLVSTISNGGSDNFNINYTANGVIETSDFASFTIIADNMDDIVFYVKATTINLPNVPNLPPDKPLNQSPVNGSTEISIMPTLQSSEFSDSNSGDSHSASQWQVSENSSFSSTVYDSGETTEDKTNLTVGNSILNYSTKYYWHIKYKDDHGAWSEYSDSTYFETRLDPQIPPYQPTNIFPVNGAINISTTPTLESSGFSHPNKNSTHSASRWIIAKDSSFYDVVFDSGETLVEKTSLILSATNKLKQGVFYYWHIMHKDNDGTWSEFSQSTTFRTIITITNHYISLSGNHIYPFLTWKNAATNIQAALNAATAYDTIFITNGVYYPNNTLVIDNHKTLKSINGPKSTLIIGKNVLQCIKVVYYSTLDGLFISEANNGGVRCSYSTIKNSIICSNTARFGGGINCSDYSKIINCTIFENNAVINDPFVNGIGGGIYSSDSSIKNCLIYQNFAFPNGGAIYCEDSSIYNCTIVNNSSSNNTGGVLIRNNHYANLQNNILWNNVGEQLSGPVFLNRNNCIENWQTTTDGIITNNPEFLDADSDNFHLNNHSPCIDTGYEEYWMIATKDLDGNPRITKETVDIGAYELGKLNCSLKADKRTGNPPLKVNFTGLISGTNIEHLCFSWDFNNDGIYDLNNQLVSTSSYIYKNEGNYSVGLTISNNYGELYSSTKKLYIEVLPEPFLIFHFCLLLIPAYLRK